MDGNAIPYARSLAIGGGEFVFCILEWSGETGAFTSESAPVL